MTQAPSRGWKLTLGFFLAAFAFLLASFPARHAEVWRHLAAGRLFVHGEISAGAQLSRGSSASRPATPLYDLASYLLFSVGGGAALVFVKALLVGAMAVILFKCSRGAEAWWPALLATLLALLAMSHRLLLQPATVSCFFLALAMATLNGREDYSIPWFSRTPGWLRRQIPLWILFALWVNIDSWFLVGLLVVLLTGIGQLLDGPRPQVRLVAILLSFVGVAAACLLNLQLVQVYPLALESRVLADGDSGKLASLITASPFLPANFAVFAMTAAGLAYLALLALGLLSFAADVRCWRWQRFLPWLALALLSACHVAAVPFFAVIGGPILAWNLQNLWAARAADAPASASRPVARLIPWLILPAMFALLACAWTGWLQASPYEPRRWAIETAPALERAARTAARWRQEDIGPSSSGALHLSPDTFAAFAWFCPEEAGILERPDAEPDLAARWQEQLRHSGAKHLVVYDADRGRLLSVLQILLDDPRQWPLLSLEGDVAIFGWRDPLRAASPDPFAGRTIELDQLAFRAAADKKAPRLGGAGGAEAEPAPRRWWDAFWLPAPPRSIDRDEAAFCLTWAEALRRAAPRRHQQAWEALQSAGLSAGGIALLPNRPFEIYLRLVLLHPKVPERGAGIETLPPFDRLTHVIQSQFAFDRDDAPPAALYLAVRAARRCLADNPDDPQANLLLGETYLRLLASTRERSWSKRMPEILQLRRAQAGTALRQALLRKPDLAQAHLRLGGVYQDMGFLDLAFEHLSTYFRLARDAGPPPEVDRESWQSEEKRFEEQLANMAKAVEEKTRSYAAAAKGLKLVDRAQVAARLGLAGKARDMLMESDIAAFGPAGMGLELDLLINTGRAKDVRDWTQPQQKETLGPAAYHWMRARACAASGNYPAAQAECSELGGASPARFRELASMAIAKHILDERPGEALLPQLITRWIRWTEFRGGMTELTRGLRLYADAHVLRGLLALEEGDSEEAGVSFRLALTIWRDEATAARGAGLDFKGRTIAQACLGWVQ